MNTPGAHQVRVSTLTACFVKNSIITVKILSQVHHGRNKECIDKNYGAVFIIWDRIYGTYQPRDKIDTISYGLVGGYKSFDFFDIQFKYYKMLFQKGEFSNFRLKNSVLAKSNKDYFRSFWYGPGWNTKKAHLRLGDPADIPEPPKELFNPKVGYFDQFYAVCQLLTATAVMSHFLEIQSV